MSESATHNHKIRIHIDRTSYEADNPTTGAELYRLGGIAPHRELFREAGGNHEDRFVPKSDERIELKLDDHFYSQKEITIIVNAEKKKTVETKLSFDEVVKLAYPQPLTGENVLFTITYRNGPRKHEEGELIKGHSVQIKNGMVFNVTPTDKS